LHGADRRRIEVDSDVWSRLFYRGRLMSDVADFDEAAVQTVERWVARPPGQPWVLFVPLLAPHCPFQVQEPWFSQHDRQVVPPPVPAGDEEREPAFMQCIRDYYGTQRAGDEVWREVIATYYGMVSRLDHHVGRIFDAVEQHGMLDNTLTCFFVDHGEYLGDFGLIEKSPSAMHDCITRDPLIISGPGSRPDSGSTASLSSSTRFQPSSTWPASRPTIITSGGAWRRSAATLRARTAGTRSPRAASWRRRKR
jgi:arylsulfatase A-like enzyme